MRYPSHNSSKCNFLNHDFEKWMAQLPNKPALQDLINNYKQYFQQYLNDVLLLYNRSNCDFDVAVRFAGSGLCPVPGCQERYMHQKYHTSYSVLASFSRTLYAHRKTLFGKHSFEELYEEVRNICDAFMGNVKGIGDLTIYDAALRISVNLGIPPQEYVYTNTGTGPRIKSWEKQLLSPQTKNNCPKAGIYLTTDFLPPLAKSGLTAYEIEDFLCVYHKQRSNFKIRVLK